MAKLDLGDGSDIEQPYDVSKLERVPEDHPERCKSMFQREQCCYRAIRGGIHCPMHGSTNRDKKATEMYRLQVYQTRVQEFAKHDQVKSLRDEIGITRMMLESVINKAGNNQNMLIMYSDKIMQHVETIRRLIESCQKLEERNNLLLERKVIVVIADSIVSIVGKYVDDPDQLAEIGVKICESIESAASPANNGGIQQEIHNGAE